MIATRASDNQTTIAYANMIGANDGLVFDGGGYVNQNGRPVLDAPRFREGWSAAVVDLDRTTRSRREASTWRSDLEQYRYDNEAVREIRCTGETADRTSLAYPAPEPGTTFFLPSASVPEVSPRDALLDDFFEALALGIADYYRKIGVFKGIGVALSGGRDSLMSVLAAWRAVQLLNPGVEGDALKARMRETCRRASPAAALATRRRRSPTSSGPRSWSCPSRRPSSASARRRAP
jgi:NAD+ synthase (glutamine-hydrolysing)